MFFEHPTPFCLLPLESPFGANQNHVLKALILYLYRTRGSK